MDILRFFCRLALLLLLLLVTTLATVRAQTPIFTRQDTVRGAITPERAWWDLTHYHLNIRVNPADSSVRGVNTLQYRVLQPRQQLQIDLQAPLQVEKVQQNGRDLTFKQDGNAYYIQLQDQ